VTDWPTPTNERIEKMKNFTQKQAYVLCATIYGKPADDDGRFTSTHVDTGEVQHAEGYTKMAQDADFPKIYDRFLSRYHRIYKTTKARKKFVDREIERTLYIGACNGLCEFRQM
jgi:hypothetical protein